VKAKVGGQSDGTENGGDSFVMGKMIYGFGDSLVDGHCLHIGMLDALAEKYGMEYRKYAVNGYNRNKSKPV